MAKVLEFQLQHQPFNLACCFESKLGPMEPGCFGLDGHSGLPPSVDALVPGKCWHDALYDAAGSLELLRALTRGLQMESSPLRGLTFALSD